MKKLPKDLTQKDLKQLIKLAQTEIKEWEKFIAQCQKKLK